MSDEQAAPNDGTEIEPSAATVASEHLLSAIAGEAVYVTENQPGDAWPILAQLARAYALTTIDNARGTQISGPVPREVAELWEKRIPVVVGYPVDATPNPTEASAAARDELLYAIANEVKHVAKSQAGSAYAALVELARAYALVTGGLVARTVGQPWMSLLVFHEGEQSEGPDALGISTER